MWTLSVTLYSDSEASAQKRQNDCEVLGGYALELELVDQVASSYDHAYGVSISMFTSPPVPRGSFPGDTEEQIHVARYRPKGRMRSRLCKASMPKSWRERQSY